MTFNTNLGLPMNRSAGKGGAATSALRRAAKAEATTDHEVVLPITVLDSDAVVLFAGERLPWKMRHYKRDKSARLADGARLYVKQKVIE